MKTQTIINCVFAVAFVGYVVWQLNPTCDTITCNKWKVVDKDGKIRIAAATVADGDAGVQWFDKDEKQRIGAGILADGTASVQWLDKDEKMRINVGTTADGIAAVLLFDKGEKLRIGASTKADGTVDLPTKDLSPPKKP